MEEIVTVEVVYGVVEGTLGFELEETSPLGVWVAVTGQTVVYRSTMIVVT